jgi:hypothetical protein
LNTIHQLSKALSDRGAQLTVHAADDGTFVVVLMDPAQPLFQFVTPSDGEPSTALVSLIEEAVAAWDAADEEGDGGAETEEVPAETP